MLTERERKEGGREGRKLTRKEAALSGSGTPAGAGRGFSSATASRVGDCKGKFPSKFLKFLDCIQEMRFANAGSVLVRPIFRLTLDRIRLLQKFDEIHPANRLPAATLAALGGDGQQEAVTASN